MAGAVLIAAPDIVLPSAALAQSVEAQQSFAIEGPTAVEFPENSTAAIATYRATNATPDSTISWSIDGADARRLSIDDSGVLRFTVAKNFERPNDGNRDNEYVIDLSATDGSTHVSVEVVVTITDINEPPAFDLDSAEFSVTENAPPNERVGAALVAVDPDDTDSLVFSLEGETVNVFHIDAEGQIRVHPGAGLDYETSGVLSLTARVTDQGGLSDSLPVRIQLTDADDPGVVTFSPARPFIGAPFSASVTDDDGVTGRIRWRWHRARDVNSEFMRIDGATGSSYTPVEDDEGYILRATVSYEDNFEVGASASGISVAVARNGVPEFDSASITLTVPEEAPAGTDVGDSVSATDSDGDDLAYTLSGEDASHFEVNALTGQISVGAQALPDSETKGSYTVIVTATDTAGATAFITVMITAGVLNAPPVITGPATASYAEKGIENVATYSATDPEDDGITWDVAGVDLAWFGIHETGELMFNFPPDYEKPKDANEDNVYELIVTAFDGKLTSTLDIEVTVTNVNESGIIKGSAAVAYTENSTKVVGMYSVTDPEGDGIAWDVTGADAGRFSINARGELMFNSSPDYEEPTDANRDNVYEVIVTAWDGDLTSTLDVEVTVTNVSEAPSIMGPSSVSYAENGTASVAMYSAIDLQGDGITWRVVGADVARFEINTTGELTFSSSPDYEKPRDANEDNVYEVTVTALDGDPVATLDVEVSVTNVNDAPSVTGPATVSYEENGTAAVALYIAIDPEGEGITWDVAGVDTARVEINELGQLTFKSSPDYEKPRDANKDNVYEVIVTASDGDLTSTLDVEVTVTNDNEAASITGAATVSYAENGMENVATYSATDPEGDGITWGMVGPDVAWFGVHETGELKFNLPPDYENPKDANKDNVYEVAITASDGHLESTLDVEVTVTDVAEAILITGPATISYAENGTASVATYAAADSDGDGITWDIAGADAARFEVSAAGELTFNSSPDYENPNDANNDNVYELVVMASGGDLVSTLDVEVTVTSVNEAVLVTGLTTVSYLENGTTEVAFYTAIDPEGEGITWDVAGVDTARVEINELGQLTFKSSPDYEKPRDANKDNVYEVIVTASDGDLTSTLDVEVTVTNDNEAASITGAATVSYAENGMENVATYSATDPEGDGIRWGMVGPDVAWFGIHEKGELTFNFPPDYENPNDANKDNVYEVAITASDGHLESTLDVEVTVTDVAEAILITGAATVNYLENGMENVATYSATDPDGNGITWNIAGADAARFEISTAGELTFNSSPDYENPNDANNDNVYELVVMASDSDLTSTLDVKVTITNDNEAASITGAATVSYSENGTTGVAFYTAIDPEGDEITWDVAGADAARFEVSAAGELTFNSSPDYENPNDANNDNVYELVVMASGGDLTSTLDVEVTVTNVNEAPSITGPSSVSYAENGTTGVAVYSAIDPEEGGDSPIDLEVVGTDAAHFVIDKQGGLAFAVPPNFEDPLDADADNMYLIRVVVNDGANESGLSVIIEVTDENDAPRFPSATIVAEIPENSCPGTHPVYRGIGAGVALETDEDGDPLTYALSGPDGRTFVIHPPTGYVTLSPGTLLDFEASRKPFLLLVSVSDGRDDLGNVESEFKADDYLDLTVRVRGVDELPVFAETQLILDACGNPVGHEPGQLRRAVTAGARGGSPVGAALSAIDPEGAPVHFRIVSQSENGAFIVDSVTGQIMVAPGFSPRDARRVYTLRVAATDGGLESHVEVRIAVVRASRPTLEPDIDASPTPKPERAHTTNDEEAFGQQGTEDRSHSPQVDGLAGNTEDEAVGSALISARLVRIEPVFVSVPRAVQTPLFGGSEVEDQTGRVRLTAPAATLAVPYQVRLTQDEAVCVGLRETAPPLACVCVSVEFFDVAGEPLAQKSLNRPALLEIVVRTQDEAANSESRDGRMEIGHDSIEMMMRYDHEQDWEYIHANLREPADGSSILMARIRSPGQYMALVTESKADKENSGSAPPVDFVKVASVHPLQGAVNESSLKRTVSFEYDPVAARPPSEPAPSVSTESEVWHIARLLIALLLDVTVALSAGLYLQRIAFRGH